MSRDVLTIESLAKIDGERIKIAWEQAVRRIEADCADRPALAEARVVTLAMRAVPKVDDEGELVGCDVQFVVTEALPKRKSKVYDMALGSDGLVYNEMAPENAGQRTLDELSDLDERTGEIRKLRREA